MVAARSAPSACRSPRFAGSDQRLLSTSSPCAAFGSYTSLLDFCRKVDRRIVSRHDLILLIKLGAFGFTALSRAQLVSAEQYYSSLADVMRFGESDPAGLSTLEDDLGSGAVKYVQVAEWWPEIVV